MSDQRILDLDLDTVERMLAAAEADAPGRYVVRLSLSYDEDFPWFGRRPPSLPERVRREPPTPDINGPCSFRPTGNKRARRRQAAKSSRPPLQREEANRE